MSIRKNQLEDAFNKLVEHCYVLTDQDFEPPTASQVMAEYLDKQASELLNQADLTLTKYEAKIKEAENIMSRKQPPPTLTSAPPPASPIHLQPTPKSSTPAMFRPNPDLKPSMLEKECSYQEVVHFTELWSSYKIAGYGSVRTSLRKLCTSNCSHSSMLHGGPNS